MAAEEYRDQIDLVDQLNDRLREKLELEKEVLEQVGLYSKVQKAIEVNTQKIAEELEVGGVNTQALVDLNQELLDSIERRIEAHEELTPYVERMGDPIKEQAERWKDIKNTVLAIATDPMTWLIAGAIKLGKILWDKVSGAWSNIKDTTWDAFKGMGLTAGEAVEFGAATAGAMFSVEGLLYGTQGIAESSKAIAEHYGNIEQVSRQTILHVAEISRLTGLSGEEAVKFEQSMTNISADSLETVKSLARASKMAPGPVMKSVASSTQAYAISSEEALESLVRAAAEAKKLGMELSTVEGIGENLLDIETSLGNELEAQMALGRSINLDKARELALAGDLEGLTKEITNLGITQEEFASKNVIQQDMIASSLGMSRKEFGEMLNQQKALSEEAANGTSIFQKMGSAVGTAFGGVAQAATTIAPMVTAAGGLFTILGPVLGKLGAFFGGIFGKIFGGGGAASKALGSAGGGGGINMGNLMKAAAAITLMGGALAIASVGFATFTSSVDFNGLIKGALALAALVTAVQFIGNVGPQVIQGSLALAILGAALIPAAFAFSLLADVPVENMMAFAIALPVLAGAVTALGFAMFFAAPFFFTGVAAIAALGAAIIPLASAVALIGQNMAGMDGLMNFISTMSGQVNDMYAIGAGFSAIGFGLMSFGMGLAMVAPFLNVAGALGLAETGGEGGGQEDGTQKIVDAINSLGDRIESRPLVVEMDGQKVGRQMAVGSSYGSRSVVR